MLRIQQLNLEIPRFQTEEEYDNYQKRQLGKKILKLLKISSKDLKSFSIIRRSLDARKKPTLFYSYIIDVEVSNEVQLLQKNKFKNVSAIDTAEYRFPELPFKGTSKKSSRPVIVGLGPAGLFCGYYLAKQGLNPIILERGKPVEQRLKDVEDFWNSGVLNTESNVQFGEGGAGTFSDGKLTTRISDPRCSFILEEMIRHGAPEEIR